MVLNCHALVMKSRTVRGPILGSHCTTLNQSCRERREHIRPGLAKLTTLAIQTASANCGLVPAVLHVAEGYQDLVPSKFIGRVLGNYKS